MPRNRIRIDLDLSDFDRALDALEGPGPETQAALTQSFAETFAYIDSRVPVDTGRLKASAQVAISEDPGDEWSASVTYGAPETGVVYAPQAIYHARTFDGLEQFNDDFTDAMYADVRAFER